MMLFVGRSMIFVTGWAMASSEAACGRQVGTGASIVSEQGYKVVSIILSGAAEQRQQCFELQGMYYYGSCTTVQFGRWFQLQLWHIMHHGWDFGLWVGSRALGGVYVTLVWVDGGYGLGLGYSRECRFIGVHCSRKV